ncbi:uncharacterized protein EI90DRAFT_3037475 [Cantharellus anzutake]|uniref:uncharacterized protein n=1 Tax=Cantharellus anzutake TaxID=1750568 RepID=UPI00190563FD|nr:uncharacterized protein EI90DRAFT_3037475 [Cantharellus anzutake]KAF8339685.1 hypothetical protein EI90DRAFT_3037475 [Cantharellus anzutake]
MGKAEFSRCSLCAMLHTLCMFLLQGPLRPRGAMTKTGARSWTSSIVTAHATACACRRILAAPDSRSPINWVSGRWHWFCGVDGPK